MMENGSNRLDDTLKQLIALAAQPPAKTVEALSVTVNALARVLIEQHLLIRRMTGPKETTTQTVLTRIVAPLLVGVLLWLLVDLGPSILKHIP